MTAFSEVTDLSWVDQIAAVDEQVPDEWVCNTDALMSPDGQRAPSAEALREFLSRDRSTVVIATEGDDVVGYVIADRANDDDGCRGRWVGTTDADVLEGLLDVLVARHGWVYGRITNKQIQEAMLTFGCVRDAEDPEIFRYWG